MFVSGGAWRSWGWLIPTEANTLIPAHCPVITASSDCTVKLWSTVAETATEGSAPSQETRLLATLGNRRSCGVVGTCGRCEQCRLIGHCDFVRCLATCEQTSSFVSAGLDRRILHWDAREVLAPVTAMRDERAVALELERNIPASVYALVASSDGRLVVSGSSDRVCGSC